MMIGAHPDDVDICTCGITKRLVSKDCIVRFVSMTTGNAGHQTCLLYTSDAADEL